MIVQKFQRMVLRVNLESETEEFFTICKVFGSCFMFLRYTKKEWDDIRKLALWDEKQIHLLQSILKNKLYPPGYQAEIQIEKNTSILFSEVIDYREVVFYPYNGSKRVLRIKTMAFEKEIDPESFVVIDYNENPTLVYRDRYLNLLAELEKTMGLDGCEELVFQKENMSKKKYENLLRYAR